MVGLGIILFSPWRQTKVREEPGPATVEETPVVQEETAPPPVVPEKEETDPPVGGTTSLEQAPVLEETIVIKEAPPDQTQLIERISEPKEMDRGDLTLQIQAIEETWIAFQVDSHLPREITLRPGQPFSQRADDHIKLKIGNAGGVIVTFNGKDLGSLGGPGKIVRLSLTQKGYEFKKRDDFEIPGYEDEVKPTDIH
jgi:cytoskeleton protein RodZ